MPSMLVHDAVLLEVRGEDQIEQGIEIMKAAGRDVCGGFEIGVDVAQKLKPGANYQDKRGREMWEVIMRTLRGIGALAESENGHTQNRA